jgi:translation initiation factor IF-2
MDLKIRIFALAKELGIDSKDLIEHCNAAGIKLKNSPLASISPEERDRVLQQMKKGSPSAVAAPATEDVQMTPFARDPMRDAGKIRSIKPVVSRPPLARDRGTVAVEVAPEAPASEARPAVDTEISPPVEMPPPTVAASSAAVEEPPASPPSAGGPLRRTAPGAAPEEASPALAPESAPRTATPMRPDDYIAPGGGARAGSSIREMKPRGSIVDE